MDWLAAPLLTFVLSNAVMVCVLAAIAFGVTRLFRSPPLAHAVWIVVLLKLVTPPLISLSEIEAREAEITKELGEEPATPRRGR